MSQIKSVSADNAFRVVEALAKIGGTGRFHEIEAGTNTSTSVTVAYAASAIDRGWVAKTGTPKSINSRYAITDAGKDELRKRKPAFTITVPLGSGLVALAASALDMATVIVPADETPGTVSLRQRLMTGICEEKQWATLADLVEHIRRGPDDTFGLHEVQHIIYALSQQGLVVFVESRTGTQKNLTKIRATKRLLEQEGVAVYNREVNSTKGGGTGQVPQHANDGTDFRTHQTHAEGGPITRSHIAPEPRVTTERPVLPVPVPVAVTMDSFPVISSLLARRFRLDMAAELLEAAGQVDLALAVLAKIDDYSDLEREAMNLYATVFGKKE